MGWEARKNGLYYYRKERIGGKVRSVYVGNSETAHIIALLDEIEADKKELAEYEDREEKQQFVRFDDRIDELSELNRALVDALFLMNGYRQHERGEWRRKRK